MGGGRLVVGTGSVVLTVSDNGDVDNIVVDLHSHSELRNLAKLFVSGNNLTLLIIKINIIIPEMMIHSAI